MCICIRIYIYICVLTMPEVLGKKWTQRLFAPPVSFGSLCSVAIASLSCSRPTSNKNVYTPYLSIYLPNYLLT